MSEARADRQRLDRWLWQGRFFKTRTLAARAISEAGVRVNGARIDRPAQLVGPGDVLTFAQGRGVRVVEVTGLAQRRGPAAEAQATYADRTPPATPRAGRRPTGRDRRRMDGADAAARDASHPVEPGPGEV